MFEQNDLSGFDAVLEAKRRLDDGGRRLYPAGPDASAGSYWREPARPTMTLTEMAAEDAPSMAELMARLAAVWRERGDDCLTELQEPLVAAAADMVRTGAAGPTVSHTTYVMY